MSLAAASYIIYSLTNMIWPYYWNTCQDIFISNCLQALVGLAEEISNYEIPEGSRKINGKYIQSHLLSRLEGKTSSRFYFLNRIPSNSCGFL